MCKYLKTIVNIGFCIWLGLGFSACQVEKTEQKDDSQKAFYQQRLEKYLLKSPELKTQITLSDSGLTLYNEQKKVEYSLTWRQSEDFAELLNKNPQKAWEYYQKRAVLSGDSLEQSLRKPQNNRSIKQLEGWRIALDPGHFAGSLKEAKMEGKFIEMTFQGRHISFFESKLAWFTAKILKDTLEQLGAEVLLTRDAFGHTAFDKPYQDWFEEFAESQKKQGKTTKLNPQHVFFKVFRKLEFNERVRKINAFRPHLTLIIHYNVDASNNGWTQPSAKNNAMAFVGGSFLKGELDKEEARFNLLRLLLSEDFENSVQFSNKILEGIELRLGIKPIPSQNSQSFLKKFCLPTSQRGVYARNLTLARKVRGTICYAEPLYQDNIKELERLSEASLNYEGVKLPHRLQEVAEAYLLGILNYANRR